MIAAYVNRVCFRVGRKGTTRKDGQRNGENLKRIRTLPSINPLACLEQTGAETGLEMTLRPCDGVLTESC